MSMNRFFGLITGLMMVAGCATRNTTPGATLAHDTDVATAAPTYFGATGTFMYGTDIDAAPHRIAVLLPTSGPGAAAGTAIRTSIEMAVLTRAPKNLSVSFYDTGTDADTAIRDAVASNPDVILGPLFADVARKLRNVKDGTIPALAFTSDASALGNGVMTMALMPENSIEVIMHQMITDGATNFIIIAPETDAGRAMAGAARARAGATLDVSGIFYYTPGDATNMNDVARAASMNGARTAANTRAREILSDILTREELTSLEKSSLNSQLDKLNKMETLGHVPYQAVLFLGDGDDTKKIASFLRYYGLTARDARFYGTAVWDGGDIATDFTMSGAKYATLAPINENFANMYEMMSGTMPSRMASVGYDAANMAIGMLYSNQLYGEYLLNPNGYMGIDGAVRMRIDGTNQRGLRVLEFDGTDTGREIVPAPEHFITPIYGMYTAPVSAMAMELKSAGINPTDYIQIPPRLADKYRSNKTYGATKGASIAPVVVGIVESDNTEIQSPDFKSNRTETVKRTYIDSVEINE